MSPKNLKAGTPRISTSTSGAWVKFKPISSESLFIISRARVWSWNVNILRSMHWIYYFTQVNLSLLNTFLLIAQNLQSEAEGGRTWFTIRRFTGTCSFFKEAHSLDDSLIAITYHKKKSEVLKLKNYIRGLLSASC